MNKKHIFLLTAFTVFLSACSLFPQKEKQVIEVVSSLSPFEESLQLDADYISHFRLDGLAVPGEESKYLVEKKKLFDEYNAGNRSLNLLRAYIYLASLEWDFSKKDELEKELCKKYPETCSVSVTRASISGRVQNSLGKPVSGAIIEVLGTDHTTTTDAEWRYTLAFNTQSPSVLRLRASTNDTMIDIKKIQIDDVIRKSFVVQEFEKNFTLITPFATHDIDTVAKTISGTGSAVTNSAYVITTPYTKYTIPFGVILNQKTPYQGKLKAMVFEFNRASGGILLDADAFDSIDGFAASLFVTYGMPYIIFVAEDGTRLDIENTNPMFVATTLRERDDNMRTKNFDILYKRAFEEGQKNPGQYPITNKWLFDNGNLRIIPPFWVLDRSTGFWDNVGFRYATMEPESPYNIESPFYTVFVGKR